MNASETLCGSVEKSQLVLCVERYTDYYFFFRKVIEQIKSTVLGIRRLKSAL